MPRKRKLSPCEIPQSVVEQDYASTAALKVKDAKGALHLFFSPWRVPVGLTDEEVAICVLLYQFRKAQTDRQIQKALEITEYGTNKNVDFEHLLWPKLLPDELSPLKVMTRKRFRLGIYKYLAQVAKPKTP